MQTFMEGWEEEESEKMDIENTPCMEKNPTLVGPDTGDRNKSSCWLMGRETVNGQANDLPIGLLWVESEVTKKHVLPSGMEASYCIH